jgi:hypothetical protein
MSRGSGTCRHAIGASSPKGHFCLVDLIAEIVGRGKARGISDGTVDVDHPVADLANEVMVVVADAVLVAGWRTGGLDPPEQALVCEGG